MSDSKSTKTGQRRSNRGHNFCASKSAKKRNFKTGPFTNEEKELILSALYNYGPYVDKIQPLLPDRSREQVRDFLTSWFRRVRKVPVVLSERDIQTSQIKEPIEIWLDKIKKETKCDEASSQKAHPIPWYPFVLGFIAKYENHPHPTEASGVDFKKLYEFLETMLCGNTPKDLSFVDALFMLSSLRKLKIRLEKVDFHKDEMFLKRSSSSQGLAAQPRTYKRAKKEVDGQTSSKELEALLLSKYMNPLGLPLESFSVEERLKSQSEI